jgi:hypothetical protein
MRYFTCAHATVDHEGLCARARENQAHKLPRPRTRTLVSCSSAMQYNTMDLPSGSANMPMQQFQLLQQQRPPSFNGYGTFIAPHPSLMYATRDVAFYPSTLAASDYSLPYTVQPTEKTAPTSAAESPPKPDPAPPPAKAPRTSKKSSDKAGSTYASRHQAAESRRRQRINDRC